MRSRVVRLDGVRVDAAEAVVGAAVRRQILRGDYEFAERRLLADLLRPGDRVAECGAGIGVVGLVAARIVGAERVTSFEANPALAPVIAANHALNGLAPALRLAAVTVDGAPASFFVADTLLSSSLHDRGAGRAVTVEGVALAAVLVELRPTVLVLDVEGAETALLAHAALDGVRAVLVETHAAVTGAEAVEAMVAAVEAQGFAVARRAHRNLLFERDIR